MKKLQIITLSYLVYCLPIIIAVLYPGSGMGVSALMFFIFFFGACLLTIDEGKENNDEEVKNASFAIIAGYIITVLALVIIYAI